LPATWPVSAFRLLSMRFAVWSAMFQPRRPGAARSAYRYTTVVMRTGADYEIELPVTVTPLGAIARLEHALSNFEGEQDDYRRRREDASRRLASYRPRIGEAFAFEAELERKREQLVDLEADLATSTDDSPGFVVGVADGGTRQAA
jgi:hypothetical protein